MSLSVASLSRDVENIRRFVAVSEAKRTRERKCYISIEGTTITLVNDDNEVIQTYNTHASPTLEKFHNDRDKLHRCVMGPRGSGKSSAMCAEILLTTILSDPCKDGIKRAKWLVGRQTYRELETTTIRTVENWLGFPELGWHLKKQPPEAKLRFFDGEHINEIEILFISFDTPGSAKKALSLELSGAYFNESSEISQEPMNNVVGCLGRYPDPNSQQRKGGFYWRGVVYDSNSFADYHPFYTKFLIDKPEGHRFYRQPGGMIETKRGVFEVNPKHENKIGLPDNYYRNMSLGKPLDFIRTQICNEFGTYNEGKPCHPEYDIDLHSKPDIDFNTDYGVWLGWDYGGTNACVVGQKIGNQLFILKEYMDSTVGLTQFVENVGKSLAEEFKGALIEKSIGDPSNNRSLETARQAHTVVTRVLDVTTRSAWTNNVKARLESVDRLINSKLIGNQGSLQINRKGCPMLHAGMSGKYQFDKVQLDGKLLPKEVPKKDEYSHVADCLQYLALTFYPPVEKKKPQANSAFKSLVAPRY